MASEIFVSLLGEGVDVWRPVLAERLHGSVFRIAAQPYDEKSETWEFLPSDVVVCETIESSSGTILAATGLAERHNE